MKLPAFLDPPFWWTWPSLIVELAGGLLLGGAAAGLTPWWWARPLLAVGGSLIYERWVDPNRGKPTHDPVGDVLQRFAGTCLAFAAVAALHW